jgi:hypothetical protein
MSFMTGLQLSRTPVDGKVLAFMRGGESMVHATSLKKVSDFNTLSSEVACSLEHNFQDPEAHVVCKIAFTRGAASLKRWLFRKAR